MQDDPEFSDDPLQVYLREIRRVPPLDPAEEMACIAHILARDEMAEAARTRLVESHLELVVSLAEPYRSEQHHLLELIEKGNEGLLRAVEALSGYPGSFSAHATPFIQSALDSCL